MLCFYTGINAFVSFSIGLGISVALDTGLTTVYETTCTHDSTALNWFPTLKIGQGRYTYRTSTYDFIAGNYTHVVPEKCEV